ncbi:MAG: hypothetical protein IPH84_00585 [Bacteroidales bacterium]|nr:hypothetical protein [Bacteroidales bacterium]
MKSLALSKTTIFAIIPICLLGISWFLDFIVVDKSVYYTTLIISIFSMFLLFAWGWVKDFPVWTIHSIGFCILTSIYLTSISIPQLMGRQLLGLYGLLPLAITMLVALTLHFSLNPLIQLYQKVKNDKSILIFMVYGFLPVAFMFAFDEVHAIKFLPIAIILILMTAMSVVIYLGSNKKVVGIVTIISGFILTNAIAITVSTLL